MTVNIRRNGPAGQEPEPLQAFLDRLCWMTLDPRFEQLGNFVLPAKGGQTHFYGNFLEESALFDILTDEPDLIRMVTHRIRLNQDCEPYQSAREARRSKQEAA